MHVSNIVTKSYFLLMAGCSVAHSAIFYRGDYVSSRVYFNIDMDACSNCYANNSISAVREERKADYVHR